MIRVAHIVTGLGVGGAETMLTRLVSRADRSRFDSTVISLSERGALTEVIESAGVSVVDIGMRRSVSSLGSLVALRRTIREQAPDVVQTWMYHADLLGGAVVRTLGSRPVVWTLRQSNLGREANKLTTLLVVWTCARLSSMLPTRVICGSNAAYRSHAAIGYSTDRMVVVPNGFDTDEFRPDAEARQDVRRELGIAANDLLVGLFGRFDVQKDHENFALAAGRVARRFSNARFVLCGDGIDESNEKLMQWLAPEDLRERCRLLGRRRDMARLNAGLDVAVSSSLGEGFPNVVGEAMACGVPCVVTDVGDSRLIVGNTGIVVPPRDPEALAEGICKLAEIPNLSRARMGEAARNRISAMFRIDVVVQQYERIWEEVSEAGRLPQ